MRVRMKTERPAFTGLALLAMAWGHDAHAQASNTTIFSTANYGAYMYSATSQQACDTSNCNYNAGYDVLNPGARLPVYSNGDTRFIFQDGNGANQALLIDLGTTRSINSMSYVSSAYNDGRGVTGPIAIYAGNSPGTLNLVSYVGATGTGYQTVYFGQTSARFVQMYFGGPNTSAGISQGAGIVSLAASETTYQAQGYVTSTNIGAAHVGTTAYGTVTVGNSYVGNGTITQQNMDVTSVQTPYTYSEWAPQICPGCAYSTPALGLAIGHSGYNATTVTATYNSDANATQQGITAYGYNAYGTLSATGYNYASTNLSSGGTVNLGATRVGGAGLTGSYVVTNTGPNDGYTEGAAYGFTGTTGGFAAAAQGNYSNVAIGQTSALTFTLGSGTSGTFSGAQGINYGSNGATTSGFGYTPLGSTSLNLVGSVYQTAAASVAPAVAFGNSHVGDAATTRTVSVTNTATGALVDTLQGSVGSTTGTGITGSGTLTGVASGATNSTSLTLTRSNAVAGSSAGSATIALTSHDGALADAALTSQTVATTGNVYNYAATSTATTAVNLGATRVGGAALTGSTTIANTAAANGYSEKLNANAGTASGGFTGTASLTGIAAGSNGTATFGLGSGTSGTFSGSQTLTMVSDGAGTSNLGTTGLGTKTVNLTGSVYQTAAATVGPTVNLGTTHRNAAAATGAITVKNTATGALVDNVTGSISSVTGTGLSGSGTLAGVTAGSTDSSSLAVSAVTNRIGAISGTATVALASHDSALSDVTLASQTASITGAVNDYAKPTLAQASGPGTLSGSGNAYTLDLGTLYYGNSATTDLVKLLNALPYGDSQTAYTDLLDGSFTITSGANTFNLSGWDPFTGLAADGSARSLGITLAALTAVGAYDEKITFNGTSRNATSSTALAPITFEIMANVAPAGTGGNNNTAGVDEPPMIMVAAFALMGIAGITRARRPG